MTHRILILLAAGLALAGCEPETGAGFTGIGTSQSNISGYGLDFRGLAPADGSIPAAGAATAQDR